MPAVSKKNRYPKLTNQFKKVPHSDFAGLPLKNFIVISYFVSIFTILLVILVKNNLPPEVPLYYGLPRGNDQLTSTLGLTIPSIISIAVITINILIASLLRDDFFKKVLIAAGIASVFFSTTTILKIVFLVASF